MGLSRQVPTLSDPCCVTPLYHHLPPHPHGIGGSTHTHTDAIVYEHTLEHPCTQNKSRHLRTRRSGFRSCQVAHEVSSIFELKPGGIYTFYREIDCGQRGRNKEQTKEVHIIERELIQGHAELFSSQWKPSAVEAGLPWLRTDVWISFSKVGSFSMLSLKERTEHSTALP